MITVRRPTTPRDILQDAKHMLFVEGKGPDALDPRVLGEVFRDRIRIEPLGASFHVRSAAEALYTSHPDYYFLIDRDHHSDDFVERCWQRFPDPETANLLVWRRRELENYFILPEYIAKCAWLAVTRDQLEATILRCCKRRLYMDAANLVIVGLREELKQNWIQTFDRVEDFPNKKDALHKLRSIAEFRNHSGRVQALLNNTEVLSRFDKVVEELTGGRTPLTYGKGSWLHRLRGKGIFPEVVNTCFSVRDARGRLLQGEQARKQVARSLLQLPLEEQPEDFQQLHRLVDSRLNAA